MDNSNNDIDIDIDINKYCSALLNNNNNNNNNNCSCDNNNSSCNNSCNHDSNSLFKSFQFFMKYLYLYSNILKPNKEQLLNIKRIIDKFKLYGSSKFIRYSEFELYIILKYPDYSKFNFNNSQIESLVVKITNNHINNLSNSKYLFYWKGATYFEYIVNIILNLDDHQFKIELSNKIIKIIIEFIRDINRSKFYYNSLLFGLLSFHQLLGIDGYKEYCGDIIDFFDTSEFSAYNRDNFEIYINQIIFLIQLINYSNNNNNNNNNSTFSISNQKRESLYLKLVNCGRKKVQSNRDVVDFRQIVLNYFKRIEKEEFESHNSSGVGSIQIIDKMEFLIQVLVDNGIFHEGNFKMFLNVFKDLLVAVNKNSDDNSGGNSNSQIDKSTIKFTIKRLVTLFKELPINEVLAILNQLIRVFQIEKVISSSLFLKKYLVYLDAENYSQFINIFKINEDEIQDKEILKRSYEYAFNYLKKISVLELSLGEIFKNQQDHINSSKVLKEYLVCKLPYLVNLLDIGVIDEYILPVFNDQCSSLINYKNKIIYSSSISNSNSINININNSNNSLNYNKSSKPAIPYYLITNIIHYLINNKLIYPFEKLHLLLVNKKMFEITSKIINLSINEPLDIYYHYHSLEIQGLGNGSIIRPLMVKWLKIKISNIVRPEFYILETFKSLEVLEISGFIDDDILYKRNFKNNRSLQRIIIKCSFHDAKKSAQALQTLGKYFRIELYLSDDYIPEHKIQMKMIKQLSIEINTLFKFYNDSKLSKLSQFSLVVGSINHSLAKNFNSSLYIEKQKRIKHLEFLLLYCGSLDVLFGYFKSLENLSTLSFRLYTNGMMNIESTVSDIFRIFNNNSNFKRIQSIKITDQYGYTLDIDWSLINSFNFKDLDLKFINFQNTIKDLQLDSIIDNISDEEDYYI